MGSATKTGVTTRGHSKEKLQPTKSEEWLCKAWKYGCKLNISFDDMVVSKHGFNNNNRLYGVGHKNWWDDEGALKEKLETKSEEWFCKAWNHHQQLVLDIEGVIIGKLSNIYESIFR